MQKTATRRGALASLGTVGTVALAGCTGSSSDSDGHLSVSETLEFDAEEGAEIRIQIGSGGGSSSDSSPFRTGHTTLYDPSGEFVTELFFSIAQDGTQTDEETVTAPESGTYTLENGDWTVSLTVEVDGETVV